jgi:hypothetical protein
MMVNDAPYVAVKRIDLNIEGVPFLIVKLDVRSPRPKFALACTVAAPLPADEQATSTDSLPHNHSF